MSGNCNLISKKSPASDTKYKKFILYKSLEFMQLQISMNT